jgi:hypothetical protein
VRSRPEPTLGALTQRVLRAGGVDAAYGDPVAGIDVVPASPAAARLLARAHGIVVGRPAATITREPEGAGVVVRVPAGPAPADPPGPPPLVVTDAGGLVAAAGAVAAAAGGGTPVVLWLDFDPERPAPAVAVPRPEVADRWAEVGPDVVAALAASCRPVVLAGPGVVRAGAVPGLHGLAAAAHVGVLNTWGAKGVFDWRSRHHLATAGLQARDFELGGLADADLIVATGLDDREVPEAAWRLGPAVVVPPAALSWLSERWARTAQPIPQPPLRTALARVTQEGWSSPARPLAPSRVTLAYSRTLGAGGLVVAPGGTAGYWIARTFPTTVLGSVVVVDPAPAGGPGLAVACAAVARRRDPARPVLAVLDAPAGDDDRAAVAAVQEAARALGVAVPLQVWDEEGPAVGADELALLLDAAVHDVEPRADRLATDPSQLTRMIEAAGEVTAWRPPYWTA